MIIIFKDYDFSHNNIFQTINIEKYMMSREHCSASKCFKTTILCIMLKKEKFEYLSEKVITKLFQKKEIFIKVGRRMSINGYNILLIYEDFRWFPFY